MLQVREMYAFAVVAAVERLDLELQDSKKGNLIIQPPVDLRLGKATQVSGTRAPHPTRRIHQPSRHSRVQLLTALCLPVAVPLHLGPQAGEGRGGGVAV